MGFWTSTYIFGFWSYGNVLYIYSLHKYLLKYTLLNYHILNYDVCSGAACDINAEMTTLFLRNLFTTRPVNNQGT